MSVRARKFISIFYILCWKSNIMSLLLPSCFWCFTTSTPFSFILIAGLVKKYSQVLQRYYVQYLKGYDQSELTQVCHIGLPSLLSCKVFSGLNFKKWKFHLSQSLFPDKVDSFITLIYHKKDDELLLIVMFTSCEISCLQISQTA